MSPHLLEQLQQFDTCSLANAIETFNVRLRNEGYTGPEIRCQFPRPYLSPMVGHAVTVKIRCSSPPSQGQSYLDRTDWWDFILSITAPRVVVIQDVDDEPGCGSLLGETHAAILKSMGCVGAVTNGGVRDLLAVERMGFQLFAGHPCVSHAYSHITEIGGEVEVGGLKIQSGDLLHGDLHGILKIPLEIATELPAAAARLRAREQRILNACNAPDFNPERLREAVGGES